MESAGKPTEDLAEALRRAYPELATVSDAATEPVYVVGGAVRDLLLGRGRVDLDVVVEGDAAALAAKLGAEPVSHERFATAKVRLDGHELDIASARTELYPHPGALPEVVAVGEIEADLARRDFTINAMAVPLGGPSRLIDPHGGEADLAAGLLRVLHPASFVDDPTRAIRAARYAARLGFELEGETAALLRATDLDTVSAERREAELLRLAAEPSAPRAYELLAAWGLLELRPEGSELAARVGELLEQPLWAPVATRAEAVHAAAVGDPGREGDLATAPPSSPSEAVAVARAHAPVELVLARALGADWLDDYLARWCEVELEIGGADLIAAGIAPGPALGRGLDAALRAKLDGEIDGPEQELTVALAAARDESA